MIILLKLWYGVTKLRQTIFTDNSKAFHNAGFSICLKGERTHLFTYFYAGFWVFNRYFTEIEYQGFLPYNKKYWCTQENILRQAICNERARGMIKVLTET